MMISLCFNLNKSFGFFIDYAQGSLSVYSFEVAMQHLFWLECQVYDPLILRSLTHFIILLSIV